MVFVFWFVAKFWVGFEVWVGFGCVWFSRIYFLIFCEYIFGCGEGVNCGGCYVS